MNSYNRIVNLGGMMSKNLFEFANRKRDPVAQNKEANQNKEKIGSNKEAFGSREKNFQKNVNESSPNEGFVKDKVNNYSKLSENELMQELFKEVSKQKSSGNFNSNELARQVEKIKPMLNKSQIENLENLLSKIK